MVFYRKYRPQTIDELDSQELRETLHTVLSKEEIPHAFLFTGPKGLGKTSTARILAKVVNCTNPPQGKTEPCNSCSECMSITAGTNLDVLEIDGASNRGIDEIRDLREKIRLSPTSAKKKVYIIDEVHMLTTEAFNALLKTIEEPPSHVLFILCTTESQKVPPTIVSRCFHLSFSLATEEELLRSFLRIVQKEHIDIEIEALSVIAHFSDGAFRDGVKILEEISMLSAGKKITPAFVKEKYHVSDITYQVVQLFTYLIQTDTKKALELVAILVSQGTNLTYFVTTCITFLHTLLLEKVGIHTEQTGRKDALELTLEDIQSLVSLLTQVYKEQKYAVISQLPLEMMIVAWCTKQDQKINVSANEQEAKPTIDSLIRKQQVQKIKIILGKSEEKIGIVAPKSIDGEQGDLHTNKEEKINLLENMIYKVKTYNHSVAGILRGCSIISIDDKVLVMGTAYKFHKEKLHEKAIYDILQKIVQEITGNSVTIEVVLKNK